MLLQLNAEAGSGDPEHSVVPLKSNLYSLSLANLLGTPRQYQVEMI